MKQVKDLFKAIKKNLNASAMAMYAAPSIVSYLTFLFHLDFSVTQNTTKEAHGQISCPLRSFCPLFLYSVN